MPPAALQRNRGPPLQGKSRFTDIVAFRRKHKATLSEFVNRGLSPLILHRAVVTAPEPATSFCRMPT
jgi:hypothetical protein